MINSVFSNHIFQNQRIEIINQSAARISEARASGNDIKELFNSIIDQMSEARKQVAIESGVEDATLFGRHRSFCSYSHYYTPLTTPEFLPHHKKLVSFFQECLKTKLTEEQLKHPLHLLEEQKQIIIRKKRLGINCAIDIQLLNDLDIQAKEWRHHIHSQTEACGSVLGIHPEFAAIDTYPYPNSNPEEQAIANQQKEFHKAFKEQFPKLYEHSLLGSVFKIVDEVGKTNRSQRLYVIATVRSEIKDQNTSKLLPLSQYVTWIDTIDTLPIEGMVCNPIMISHQDSVFADNSLAAIQAIFENSVNCNPETDRETFINNLAQLRYMMAHSHLFTRGTASITEWIEESICESHGLRLERISGIDNRGDLLAFSSPMWDKFSKEYPKTIRLEN